MKTEVTKSNVENWLAQQKLDRLAKHCFRQMWIQFFILLPLFIIPIVITCNSNSYWFLLLYAPLIYYWWKSGRWGKINPKSKCPHCGNQLVLDTREKEKMVYYYLKCNRCSNESMITGINGDY